jgi:hypothetical protein
MAEGCAWYAANAPYVKGVCVFNAGDTDPASWQSFEVMGPPALELFFGIQVPPPVDPPPPLPEEPPPMAFNPNPHNLDVNTQGALYKLAQERREVITSNEREIPGTGAVCMVTTGALLIWTHYGGAEASPFLV